jgi:hypothetical protein
MALFGIKYPMLAMDDWFLYVPSNSSSRDVRKTLSVEKLFKKGFRKTFSVQSAQLIGSYRD